MALTASLSPIRPPDFGPAQAQHLLRRAAFGAPPARVDELVRMGLDRAVRSLVEYPGGPGGPGVPGGPESLPVCAEANPDVLVPRTREESQRINEARKNNDEAVLEEFRKENNRRRSEDRRMMKAVRHWWLDLMVRGDRPQREKLVLLWHSHFASRYRNVRDAWLMYQQNQLFRAHDRDFAALARGIVRDPAMLGFLNNNQNNKRRPNENLARELMELFTLGVGHYTEKDIREGARALTGYHVSDNDFAFRQGAHDPGRKTILGDRGPHDGDAFVEILLQEEACARYVALKLYRHYVADVPDAVEEVEGPARLVVHKLARVIQANGFDLRPALTLLFKSEHFHAPEVVGKLIKCPAQLVVGAAVTLGTPLRDAETLLQAMNAMGQDLFDPPSVAGWPGGRAWINTSTLFVRQNACAYLIVGQDPRRRGKRDQTPYDALAFFVAAPRRTPEGMVDHAVDVLLGPHVPSERREPLVSFLRSRGEEFTADNAAALLLLVTAMPEYQLC